MHRKKFHLFSAIKLLIHRLFYFGLQIRSKLSRGVILTVQEKQNEINSMYNLIRYENNHQLVKDTLGNIKMKKSCFQVRSRNTSLNMINDVHRKFCRKCKYFLHNFCHYDKINLIAFSEVFVKTTSSFITLILLTINF